MDLGECESAVDPSRFGGPGARELGILKRDCSPVAVIVHIVKRSIKKRFKASHFSFYKNNLSFCLSIALFLLVQISLVAFQYEKYIQENELVRVARCCGILINFNSCLIILLVLKKFLTLVRNSQLGRYILPIDDFLNFHKWLGFNLFVLSIVHTIAHGINLYLLSNDYRENRRNSDPFLQQLLSVKVDDSQYLNASFANLLFTRKSNIGWVYGTAMPTGWLMLAFLVVFELFSLSCIRKHGHFQLFHIIHWFHVFYYVLLIIHARNFWKWFMLPMIVVTVERLHHCYESIHLKHSFTITEISLFPSKVTKLTIRRPKAFNFKAGDYLYLSLPFITKYEWHPFTISSAPEMEDEIWIHIRGLGPWTNQVYEYFSKLRHNSQTDSDQSQESEEILVRATSEPENQIIPRTFNLMLPIKIGVHGPYSASTRRIYDVDHAIMVCGGIGVTPFASILQSILLKHLYNQISSNAAKKGIKSLKRVDFIWVNRDYESFEWFIDLLAQLESDQLNSCKEKLIYSHLYITSPESKKNSDLLDMVQPRRIKSHVGRPDFDQLLWTFKQMGYVKQNVFFCGSSLFGKYLSAKCALYKLKYTKEYFS